MSRKWRLLSWLFYTVGCFLVMLIGFDWKVSISVSIIVGFVCGLINELIQILLKRFGYREYEYEGVEKIKPDEKDK